MLRVCKQNIISKPKEWQICSDSHLVYDASPEVLIMGSSHSTRHFVSPLMSQELQKSCYNAGVRGQGITFITAIQEIVLARTKPSLIILNIDPDFLSYNPLVFDRLSDLHPYYWDHRNILKPILSKGSKLIDLKLALQAYQMNSTIVHIIKYYLFPQEDYEGYMPLFGTMSESEVTNIREKIFGVNKAKNDNRFIESFKKFILNAKSEEIDLIVVTSPTIFEDDYNQNESMLVMKHILNQEGIYFHDFTSDVSFKYKNELFNDISHLNDQGARLFTSKLILEIKKDLAK